MLFAYLNIFVAAGLPETWQVISMKANCGGDTEATVHHEMLHAIGVHHEHVRPDRDDILDVDTSGVDESMAHNWAKVS